MTVCHQSIIPHSLVDEFMTCTRLQYNGKLDIRSTKGHYWSFYYRLGRIVWATSAQHPGRRWRRNMVKYCPQVDTNNIVLRQQDVAIQHWDYLLLEALHKKEKISRDQVINVVENTISEILFDLAQQAHFGYVECERHQQVILDAPMSLSSTDVSMRTMRESWHDWLETGLANFSPNSAPVLRQPDTLEQMVPPATYKYFSKLNGRLTLRELALRINRDVISVTRSLLPYILRGIIELVEVADIPLQIIESPQNTSAYVKTVKPKVPLIACIDDSPQVCQMLEKIVTGNGMRFIGIHDPVSTLPTLLESKPDIILLDLIMPVANGYEICTQLRRVACFANTPIVILTGSDALFDRVRAKVVGSTDFMTKPIVAEKVMAMIHKHLPDIKQGEDILENSSNFEMCLA